TSRVQEWHGAVRGAPRGRARGRAHRSRARGHATDAGTTHVFRVTHGISSIFDWHRVALSDTSPGASPALPMPLFTCRMHDRAEIPQSDLAGAVERRRPHLVVRPVRDGNRDLTDFLATPDAVTRRLGRDESRRHRGLARPGLARDRHPT